MKTNLKKLVFSNFENIDQLPGAALLTRADFLKKNKLDEDYNFLFEDVDWCYRAKEHGKLKVVKNSKIVHLGGASWKQRLDKDRFKFYSHYFKSMLLFVKKHYSNQLCWFKLSLKITNLSNAFTHLLLLNFKKAKTQLKLFTNSYH